MLVPEIKKIQIKRCFKMLACLMKPTAYTFGHWTITARCEKLLEWRVGWTEAQTRERGSMSEGQGMTHG